jgi:hypothetical protein
MLAAPATRNVTFDSREWVVEAEEHRLERHRGRDSLFLRDGLATIADAAFTNGVIDFDVCFPRDRAFVGATWRALDQESWEWFFLRPHQSGNPDATQYTPVFNGVSGWQLYHGERYTAPLELRFDEWMHVRIVVLDELAEIYLDDLTTPAQLVDGLKREVAAGGVGLSASGPGAWFADFAYAATDDVAIQGQARPTSAPEAGVVRRWVVSEAFPEAELAEDVALEGRRWTTLEAEPGGLADLARVNGLGDGRNTVYARATIVSEREQVKRLQLGFSDRVRVYLNGRALFDGSDAYRSRDYRFLGSIGWFDALYLPLRVGRN